MDINKKLEDNEKYLKEVFANSFDFMAKRLQMPCGRNVLVVTFDGLANTAVVQEAVIMPLMGLTFGSREIEPKNMSEVGEKLVYGVETKVKKTMEEVITSCLSADTAVFIDGMDEALVIQTRGWARRGVPKPESDITIRGSKEAFAETMLVNVSLLRRRIKDPALKTERFKIGSESETDLCLVYLEGKADPKVLKILRERINSLNIRYILDTGQLEQLICDKKSFLFSTLGRSEKPDITASKILNGKVALILDGTPFVLTAPYFFMEGFSSADDYYNKKTYSNLIRILRFASYFISVLLAAFYVALMRFHMDIIPTELLKTFLYAEKNVPFGIAGEMFLVLLLYEILREAVLRLPSQISSTVGIIGGIALGDSALSIGLLSAPAVVILSITYICSAATNTQVESSVILRLLFIIAASLFGLYGILAGLFLLTIYLCGLTSCSLPYLLPAAPIRKQIIEDGIIRGNTEILLKKEEIL